MGEPAVSLDRALLLAGELEDEELLRRLRLRLVRLIDATSSCMP